MKNFTNKLQAQLMLMVSTGRLFRAQISGEELWNTYLNSFKKEDNPVFRDPKSSTKNCNHCHNFIRRYGNIVAIDQDYKIMTLFDIEIKGEYANTVEELSHAIVNSKIANIFLETYQELNSLPYEVCRVNAPVYRLGTASNVKRYNKLEAEMYGVVKENDLVTFNHFHLDLPKEFVDKSGSSIDSLMAIAREDKNVFLRAMKEISLDTLELVRDLADNGSLLNFDSQRTKLNAMIKFKKEFDEITSPVQSDNWAWLISLSTPYARFNGELSGKLCRNLTDGMELNAACLEYNKAADPSNFMRATAPFTSKQKEQAIKTIELGGYEKSFKRRKATLDDIKVTEIKHINSGDGKIVKASIFDNLKPTKTHKFYKKDEFDGVEEVSIDKFMSEILPGCSLVEVMLRAEHESNLVTLITAEDDSSKPMFKWDNNYCGTFIGNLAGKSEIKEAVKTRGGNVDALVRVSIHFPDTTDDYDLHCVEPNRNEIYYANRRQIQRSSGMLDLDAQGADGHQQPEKRVENLTYSNKSLMPTGNYILSVNNYSNRGLHTSFNIEVEIGGEVTVLKFIPDSKVNRKSFGKLNYDGKTITFTQENCEVVNSKSISKEIYGLDTNQFHKVNLVCLSPNHWGDNSVGNKYYYFMLDGCKAENPLRSYHCENLNSELSKERKVLEPLAYTMMIDPEGEQLSGIGFNATVRDELIVKLSGSTKRVVKIKF